VAEAISRVRDGSATGPLTLCADSAFHGKSVLWNCQNAGVQFSVTVRMDKSIRAAIDAIPDRAWTPIDYWIDGGTDVAEVAYTAVASPAAT
jgi:hypothetical protein